MIERARGPALALATAALAGVATVGCSVSTQQEIALGQEYAAQVEQQLPMIEDRALNQYINALGNEIARHGERNLHYRFRIVNTDVVNAFALPGGFVYVNRGLVEATDDMAELAGVLAHEIAHVEERHGAEQLERMQSTNIGLNLAYILLGRSPSGVEQAAIQVGGGAIFAKYGRDAEHEADAVGVDLLLDAGIDPDGMVDFFGQLLQEQQRRPSAVEQWFSTHPLTQDRIEAVRAEIARRGNVRGLRSTSAEYRSFKQRLTRQPAAR